jgi:uncharacterized protein (DUF486 family)
MNKGEHLAFGIILLIVGGIFLINNYYPELDLWDNIIKLWPVIIIIYGIKRISYAISIKEDKA